VKTRFQAFVFQNQLVVSLRTGALPALKGLDPATDLQVLTPFRRGPASTSQLNAFLQLRLNPPGYGGALQVESS
jgi:ATP-dependent exoDNAse (exonuclease V) alpha subunit